MRIKRPTRYPVGHIAAGAVLCLVLGLALLLLPSRQAGPVQHSRPLLTPRSLNAATNSSQGTIGGDSATAEQPSESSFQQGKLEDAAGTIDKAANGDTAALQGQQQDSAGGQPRHDLPAGQAVHPDRQLEEEQPRLPAWAEAEPAIPAELPSTTASQAASATDPSAATQPPLPEELARRCQGTQGLWCGPYLLQQPVPAPPPPRGNRTCLWGCNFVGVCDAMAGWCRCPAGWTGDDCTIRQKRPCSQEHRQHGLEPYNESTDLRRGGLTLRCAGLCDEDTATCYCPSKLAHGRVPADLSDPPGTPPKRWGRPLPPTCQPNKDEHGNPTPFGETDPGDLFSAGKGWCDADEPASTCECFQDGLGGPFCETHFEQFCINHCNGRGECQHGFCKCHPGWFGQDCAYREAANSTLTPDPGLQEARPWLAQHAHTPAAAASGRKARLRPLIYVYELPALYNQVMLQYRGDKGTCTHRLFDVQNSTYFNDGWLYGAETALHEMLLQSEHRTLDPEKADFFYLPVYTSCFIFPVLGAADFPYFHSGPVAWRTHAAANMLIEVFHWVRAHHPYWDRKGGRDHILLVTHDEGSCWVPAVLRPAIILSYWGRTDPGHVSGTGYWPDNYTADSSHPVWQPEGHVGKLGNYPCYDPRKDVVLPMFSSPGRYQASPFLGAAPRGRSMLAFFRGRLQKDNPAFSRGTRQFLARAAEQGWWEAHNIFIAEHGEPPGFAGRNYSVLMASSVFCLALMGDGWSSRFTDAVLHGCIPVVIQDQVEMELSSLLDVSAFSLRVAQADMGRLPEILKAVPRERIQEMQAALWRVWHRYFYGSYRPFQGIVRELRQRRQQWDAVRGAEVSKDRPLPPPKPPEDPAQDDALSTLMQWLFTRMLPEHGGTALEGATVV